MKIAELEVDVDGVTHDLNIEEAVSIDRTDLDMEFSNHPRIYAKFSTLAEIAKDRMNRRKWELDQLEASLDAEKRTEAALLSAQNPKFRYTETMCENEIKGDIRYKTKKEEWLAACLLANQLTAWVDALCHKKDMLISLGANHRAAMTKI